MAKPRRVNWKMSLFKALVSQYGRDVPSKVILVTTPDAPLGEACEAIRHVCSRGRRRSDDRVYIIVLNFRLLRELALQTDKVCSALYTCFPPTFPKDLSLRRRIDSIYQPHLHLISQRHFTTFPSLAPIHFSIHIPPP